MFLSSLTELKKLLEISHDHKFPSECIPLILSLSLLERPDWAGFNVFPHFYLVIPLKSELAVEMLEKGKVRFWLQAEKMSANGKVDYVFNDNLLSQGEVSGL